MNARASHGRRPSRGQLDLGLPLRGGRRRGAGRKPQGDRSGASHHGREAVRNHPVHVTLRCAPEVPSLRTRPALALFTRALRGVELRSGDAQTNLFHSRPATFFRVVHFSLQENHAHLIAEASDERSLSNGVNAVVSRFAKALNRLHGRTGKVFPDRFHAHVLRTPAEVANAVRYAVGNALSHTRRGGALVDPEWRDPYSSATMAPRPAGTWLLRRVSREATGSGMKRSQFSRERETPAAAHRL